ncbi:hypothetical protein Pan265_06210 [Mucisphaera calidilacus]|uniref:Uncharacterized protein n=1 Tax=Mucisphaera calidilacus TaxID=2527982 RepID=A0A518BV22_9BACT|nr:hypothetical protein Pan265_06210 [Mucisphaera calidilacus]
MNHERSFIRQFPWTILAPFLVLLTGLVIIVAVFLTT